MNMTIVDGVKKNQVMKKNQKISHLQKMIKKSIAVYHPHQKKNMKYYPKVFLFIYTSTGLVFSRLMLKRKIDISWNYKDLKLGIYSQAQKN